MLDRSTAERDRFDQGPAALLPLVAQFARDFVHYARWRAAGALATIVAGSLIESVGLVILVPVLSLATGGSTHSPVNAVLGRALTDLGLDGHLDRSMIILTVLAGLIALRAVVAATRESILTRLQLGFVDHHRRAIVRALRTTRWDVISRLRHARVSHVISTETLRIGTAARELQQIVGAVILLVAQCVAAAIVSPPLALLGVVVLASALATLWSTFRNAHRLGQSITGVNKQIMHTLGQFFGGLKLAISQDLQIGYVGEVEEELRRLADHHIAFARTTARRQIVLALVGAGAALAICWAALTLLVVPVGALITILVILTRMSGPAHSIQQGAQQFFQSLPAYQTVEWLQRELALSADDDGAVPSTMPADGPGNVEFRHVTFAHVKESDPPALDDLSLTLPGGTFIGITGPSGAGKTTLIDLLVGLHRPASGEIRINDRPLAAIGITNWRRQVSYVAQDPYLFHESVRQNLVWGNPQAEEADLWRALEVAGADTLVRAMPQGLETIVGERGMLVSGGERQRIAIARALVRNPRLLIFDEATNAIDVAGERALIGRLLGLAPRPTFLMIAHRRESLEHCDRVVALEAGRIVSDTHARP